MVSSALAYSAINRTRSLHTIGEMAALVYILISSVSAAFGSMVANI